MGLDAARRNLRDAESATYGSHPAEYLFTDAGTRMSHNVDLGRPRRHDDALPLRDHGWEPFLSGNATRVFGLYDLISHLIPRVPVPGQRGPARRSRARTRLLAAVVVVFVSPLSAVCGGGREATTIRTAS
jgi:hypothetical protein